MAEASTGWKRLLTSSPTNLATGGDFLEDFDAVGNGADDEAEAFDSATRFAGKADDEGLLDDGGEVAGEDGVLGDFH